MKITHSIKLSVFSYEGEDSEKIAKALASICPFPLEQEKLAIKRTNAAGFSEKTIVIFELFLEKEKHTSAFLKNLRQRLSDDQRQLLLRQAESRLDSSLDFFIRLDKPKLLDEDMVWITDSGNCFHIKISIAAYPSNREAALKVVENWLG